MLTFIALVVSMYGRKKSWTDNDAIFGVCYAATWLSCVASKCVTDAGADALERIEMEYVGVFVAIL